MTDYARFGRGRAIACALFLLALTALVLAGAPRAAAAFPGDNGKVVFSAASDGDSALWVVDADGANQGLAKDSSGSDANPVWSPDGTKIAFESTRNGNSEIYVMNPDGSGDTRLTSNSVADLDPAWSPDGTKIAFASVRDGDSEIFVMNADGTNQVQITFDSTPTREPAWSPDGTRIAFVQYTFDACCADDYIGDVVVANADGSSPVNLTNTSSWDSERNPAWSPDGGTIAYVHQFSGVRLVDADGTDSRVLTGTEVDDWYAAWSPDGKQLAVTDDSTGELELVDVESGTRQPLTTTGLYNADPDWQPVIRGYARPQGAAAARLPLTLAYQECGDDETPNRNHGPSLESPSCNPPVQSSDHLTIGTTDANGKTPRSVASVEINVCANGTTASGTCATPEGMSAPDVRLGVTANDVRLRSDLTDYTGELQLVTAVRITDRNNSPAPPGGRYGTVADIPFSIAVPCAPTTGTVDVGATCSIVTSASAATPGAVVGGNRSIWELSQIEVLDGGPDGDAETPDNTVFARQGIFVP